MKNDCNIMDRNRANTLRLQASMRDAIILAFVFGAGLGVPVGYVVKSFFG